MTSSRYTSLTLVFLAASITFAEPSTAHHSFAMYDRSINYVFTGVVVSINPDPSHLQIVFVPLNEDRTELVRDAKGERVVWNVEMEAAGVSASEGITASNFVRGTVISVGLAPLRNGDPGGSRLGALFKCPQEKPPAPGKHCDSVEGATRHGAGELPQPTQSWTP
jgi:uncharacterized protein DUF6152